MYIHTKKKKYRILNRNYISNNLYGNVRGFQLIYFYEHAVFF